MTRISVYTYPPDSYHPRKRFRLRIRRDGEADGVRAPDEFVSFNRFLADVPGGVTRRGSRMTRRP
jgi:hypothetical protein